MKRSIISIPAVVLAVSALALTGCGEDQVATEQPTTAVPSSEPTLLDLNGSDSDADTAETDESDEADGGVTTRTDAQAVVDALDASAVDGVDAGQVWIGERRGDEAAQALGVTLNEGNQIQLAAVIDALRFVCVEADGGVTYTFGTVSAESESFRSGDGACPEADVEAIRYTADLSDTLVTSESDSKAEKKAARKAAKAEKKAAAEAKEKAKRKKEREAAKAAEEAAAANELAAEALATSVGSDTRVVSALLALALENAPADPKRPDLTARAGDLLTTYGIVLGGDNRLATAKAIRNGFIACVEASPEGPSATYTSTSGQLVPSDGSCA